MANTWFKEIICFGLIGACYGQVLLHLLNHGIGVSLAYNCFQIALVLSTTVVVVVVVVVVITATTMNF